MQIFINFFENLLQFFHVSDIIIPTIPYKYGRKPTVKDGRNILEETS
jgi:hypothetical protein